MHRARGQQAGDLVRLGDFDSHPARAQTLLQVRRLARGGQQALQTGAAGVGDGCVHGVATPYPLRGCGVLGPPTGPRFLARIRVITIFEIRLPAVVAFGRLGHYKTRSVLRPRGALCSGPVYTDKARVGRLDRGFRSRNGGMSRAAKGADCKSAGYAFAGSSPASPTTRDPGPGFGRLSRGYSTMVVQQPSKLRMRVRFPLPAPALAWTCQAASPNG